MGQPKKTGKPVAPSTPSTPHQESTSETKMLIFASCLGIGAFLSSAAPDPLRFLPVYLVVLGVGLYGCIRVSRDVQDSVKNFYVAILVLGMGGAGGTLWALSCLSNKEWQWDRETALYNLAIGSAFCLAVVFVRHNWSWLRKKALDKIDSGKIDSGKIARIAAGALLLGALILAIYFSDKSYEMRHPYIGASLIVVALGVASFGLALMYEFFRPDEVEGLRDIEMSLKRNPNDNVDHEALGQVFRARSRRCTRGAAIAIGGLLFAVCEFLTLQLAFTKGELDRQNQSQLESGKQAGEGDEKQVQTAAEANQPPAAGTQQQQKPAPPSDGAEITFRIGLTVLFLFVAIVLVGAFRFMSALAAYYDACADFIHLGIANNERAPTTELLGLLAKVPLYGKLENEEAGRSWESLADALVKVLNAVEDRLKAKNGGS